MRSESVIVLFASALALCVACVAGGSRDAGERPSGPPTASSPHEATVRAEARAAGVVTAAEGLHPPSWGTAPPARRRLSAPEAWGAPVAPFEPGVLDTSQRTALLEERSARRAFEGAPPPMRHSETFVQGQFECLDCHRDGMWLGKRLARPMSHVELPNCTQCHIEAVNPVLAAPESPPRNLFDGLEVRVPPPVPHETVLREDCSACHELLGGSHGSLEPAHAGGAAERAGWPPVPDAMPHAAGDEARRDCRGCHVVAVDPSVEVAHPLGRARFSDCLACHRGDAHEAFGAPRVAPGQLGVLALPPASDLAARDACLSCHVFATPSGEIDHEPGSLPPRIPHGTFLRTRCVSCHGEFGYAGLRIDHVHRSQCVQCHLPMTDLDGGPAISFH